MKNSIRKVGLIFITAAVVFAFVGCREAQRVSNNISQQADNFNVIRRLSVINTRTDEPLFELVAAFSLNVESDNKINVICEVGENEYKKHIVLLNEDSMCVIEDVSGANVSKYHYEVNFLPEMLKPITFIRED